MARIKKKGTSGQAKNFITRTQAVRKLQVSLPDFRRLCIFKGIYPREPRNKKKASKSSTPSTTFYYTKDIQYLLHEPLLNKFRDHNALAKKIGRALGKGQVKDAARLERTQTPRITLDHIVKERYPTFVDALRDLDDALSMLFLFANLPSTSTVAPKTIALCQRLCHEFEHYLIITNSLRKSFLSIKGIYYQASIQGQDILWLVPYKFVQQITGDIDLRIMGTFVEFYTTLLGFVNYRLYTTLGLIYPPKFNAVSDEEGGELDAFMLQTRNPTSQQNGHSVTDAKTNGVSEEATARAQTIANAVASAPTEFSASTLPDSSANNEDDNDEDDTTLESSLTAFKKLDPSADDLPTPMPSSNTLATQASSLFKPYVFFLSRETPRAPLEFLIKAFGCSRVGWPSVLGAGAFTHDESDPRITHQVVDRPPAPVSETADDANNTLAAGSSLGGGNRIAGRVYVQPQWVWDSVNSLTLPRPDLYAPGATLPPHLSPFVRKQAGAYDPSVPLEQQDGTVEGDELPDEDLDSDEKDEDAVEGVDSVKDLADLEGASSGSDAELSDSQAGSEADDALASDGDFSGFSEDDADADDDAQYQRSLEAEALGAAAPSLARRTLAAAKKTQDTKKAKDGKDWELERRKMMMPRRKRKLYEKMAHGNAQRDAETEKLIGKRRRLDAAKAAKA